MNTMGCSAWLSFMRLGREAAVRHVALWLVLAGFYAVCIELFPRIGLVDIRAVPQVQLFLFVGGAAALSVVLARTRPGAGREILRHRRQGRRTSP